MPDTNWIEDNMTSDDWNDDLDLQEAKKQLEAMIKFVTEFRLSDGTYLDSLNALEDDLDTVKKMIRDFDDIMEQRIRDRRENAAFDQADYRRDQRVECAA
ncbi:hypothetical protein [Gluconacetobacter entanii]|uniref:Uncharacterized protein n=1 Tax=Gluconacetobacter entanii TaxID=108528 RepID=A0A318PWV5_9PROT|nr:hypothetical protein [Gluconacetobacter entanii]PYD63535.1 hypothetical protein CFR72_06410 [Gluconacetobacter entanii]